MDDIEQIKKKNKYYYCIKKKRKSQENFIKLVIEFFFDIIAKWF